MESKNRIIPDYKETTPADFHRPNDLIQATDSDEYDYDIEYVPAYWTSCGKNQEQYDQLLVKLGARSGTVASDDDALFAAAAKAYDQHFMFGEDMDTFRDKSESMLQRLSIADQEFLEVLLSFNWRLRFSFKYEPEQDYEWDRMLDSVLERLIARRKGRTSGYVLFSNAHRQQVKEKNPDFKFTDVGKEIGQMWGQLTDKEKWNTQAAEQNEANGLPTPSAKEAPSIPGSVQVPAQSNPNQQEGALQAIRIPESDLLIDLVDRFVMKQEANGVVVVHGVMEADDKTIRNLTQAEIELALRKNLSIPRQAGDKATDGGATAMTASFPLKTNVQYALDQFKEMQDHSPLFSFP